ncbi:MAG: PD-(D/E)XK nuclease family protein [Rikenellaceae bacterium]
MERFLGEVARELYDRYGEKISDLTLVFPSRRARLFFLDELKGLATTPIWQPKSISLDDIIAEISGMRRCEMLRLITELYRVYSQYHGDTFDKFYFWGEVLLSDFDMVDKYLVDAEKLFVNIEDIKELEADISYMTPEQLSIISFWASLGDSGDISLEKRKFLTIWRSLAPIYLAYRERLSEVGIAYSGMMQRRAAERITSGDYSFDPSVEYALIGFNALSECEKIIFKAMNSGGVAHFFWDVDNYYCADTMQEAGLFLRDNVVRFPQRLQTSRDNFMREKSFEAIAAASNAIQCKYAAQIIEQLAREGEIDKDTAIVLTDENLLQPLLYSLPSSCSKVNVTMGYPIRGSLAYSFIERLLELQSHSRSNSRGELSFYHVDVVGILTHPFLSSQRGGSEAIIRRIEKERLILVDSKIFEGGGELFATIFRSTPTWQEQSSYIQRVIEILVRDGGVANSEYNIEFLSYMHNHIVTLENSILECDVELSMSVYRSLLRKQLQMLRIPFEGEPLEGLQIMGILESRNLDFRNVIILSMSDDNFPGNKLMHPSYIPYSLRVGHQLPTPEQHEGVFAYYFYRLVQRAEKVWMLYCSRSDEKSTGEQSRYIRQVEYETGFKVDRVEVGVDVNTQSAYPLIVEKSGRVAQQLSEFTREDNPKRLSPTALYRYIACPMRFYLHSLAGVSCSDEMSDDVDAPMFGSILHAAMHSLYEPLIGVENLSDELPKLLKGNVIDNAIYRAIEQEFYRGQSAKQSDESGSMILVRDVVSKYMRTIIGWDAKNPPLSIDSLEDDIDMSFTLPDSAVVSIRGVVDRVDRLSSGLMRVIDYKTGAQHLDFTSLDALFHGDGRERMSNIIQTLLYSVMLQSKRGGQVEPSLYYVRGMNSDNYSPKLIDKSRKSPVHTISTHSEEFLELIQSTLNELFDTSVPFTQCQDTKRTCAYCDFKGICRVE